MSHTEREFKGTRRYSILGRIGSGGMGAVYRARDHDRDQVVALKTLFGVDPSSIYRLKKEFRALAKVVHPNLVAFYELVAEEGEWFFTMELVDGVEFGRRGSDGADIPALRRSLPQLAAGIQAVHEAGKLHRDLKPSNVLITPEQRVVILDFGIVADLKATGGATATHEQSGGTAAYMAPEQAEGEAVSASDWYAMGVMLYEALTGELPFSGAPVAMIAQKLAGEPPHPVRSRVRRSARPGPAVRGLDGSPSRGSARVSRDRSAPRRRARASGNSLTEHPRRRPGATARST